MNDDEINGLIGRLLIDAGSVEVFYMNAVKHDCINAASCLESLQKERDELRADLINTKRIMGEVVASMESQIEHWKYSAEKAEALLKQAQEQEPFMWLKELPAGGISMQTGKPCGPARIWIRNEDINEDRGINTDGAIPLYAAPIPQRQEKEFDADDMQAQWDAGFKAGKDVGTIQQEPVAWYSHELGVHMQKLQKSDKPLYLAPTPQQAVPDGILVSAINEAWAHYEKYGEVCPFEGQPMIYASVLEELHELAAAQAEVDCDTCDNHGRINGLTQGTFCRVCIWQEQYRTDNYKAAAQAEGDKNV